MNVRCFSSIHPCQPRKGHETWIPKSTKKYGLNFFWSHYHSIITVGCRKYDPAICQHYGSQFAPSPDFHSSDLFPHCKLHLRTHSLCTHFGLGRTHNIFYPSPVQVLSKVLGTMNTDTTEDLGAVKEIIHHKTIRGKSTKKNTRSTRPGKLHF